jgi:hypothetical protein|tara:strand:- start:404 stop:736 length:333 start_codon:yes stop_codon:yes gene_type:complete
MTNTDKGYKLLEGMYNAIYTSSEKIATQYGRTDIALITLNHIIDEAKLKENRTDVSPHYNTLAKRYNESLRLLYKHSKEICERTESRGVTLPMLRLLIDTMIRGLREHKQ